jgi:hypothetical protein
MIIKNIKEISFDDRNCYLTFKKATNENVEYYMMVDLLKFVVQVLTRDSILVE